MRKRILKFSIKLLRRALKTFFCLLFAATVAVILAITIGWFVAIKYFNADFTAKALTTTLTRVFNRPVVIGGVKLVSINAVEVENFRIIDDNSQEYNELLSVGSVVLRYDLLPILERRLVINEVLLVGPKISLIKDIKGVLNTSTIAFGGDASAQGTQFEVRTPDGKPLQVEVQDWRITSGTFSYRDLAANASHSLNGVNVRFFNLKFNDFTDYALDFVLRNNINGKVVETGIESKGSINLANFAPAAMALSNADFVVSGFRQPLNFSVSARDFINPRARISAPLPAFGGEDISLFITEPRAFNIPALTLNAEVSFSDKFSKIDVASLNLKNEDIDITAAAAIDAAQKPISAEVSFSTKEFDASKIDYFGYLKPYELKGLASAEGNFSYKNGKINFPFAAANLNGVDGVISGFIIRGVKGRYEASNNFDKMAATVSDGIFKVGRQTVSNIKGNATYEHAAQNFFAQISDTTFNKQKIKMSVAISRVRSVARRSIRTMIYLQKFSPREVFDTVEDFAQVLSGGGQTPAARRRKDTSSLSWLRNFRAQLPGFMQNISGSVFAESFESPIMTGGNFAAEVSLRGLRPGMARLSGKVDAKMASGKILKMQEAADRWAALGIAFQPFVIMHNMERAGSFRMGQILTDTPFENMMVSVDFANGAMAINNFYMDGHVIAATVAGRVNWVAEDMDLNIFTMFKNTSKRGVLSENLTDESGEPALAFRASGGMLKPQIAIRSPKKAGANIRSAAAKGLRTNFNAINKFIKEK